jgi:hypothetical protein
MSSTGADNVNGSPGRSHLRPEGAHHRHAQSLREQTINMKNGPDEEPFARSPS